MATELTSEEIKKVEFDMLTYLDYLCEQLGLKYYLMGGTLLGAIRHKGFIPWDDDIDVMMPREDYEQLVEYFLNNRTEIYQLADYRLINDYSFPIGKLMDTRTKLVSNTVRTCTNAGAFIDIFPLDRVKGIEDVQQRKGELGKLNTFIHTFSRMLPEEYKEVSAQWTWKERLIYSKYRLIGWRKLLKEYESICCRFNQEKTTYCAYIGWILHDREIWTDELIGQGTKVMFEGAMFSAPSDWNSFLTTVYGDYMMLPPKDKRITRHSFKVYWTE